MRPRPQTIRPLIKALLAAALACTATACQHHGAAAPTVQPEIGQPGKDVIWVPTPQVLVDALLDLARLTPADHLVDLGSGDGRGVLAAARRGATAHGIELDGNLIAISRRSAAEEGLTARATFEQADLFEADFSNATVVMLYLMPSLNLKLRPTLLEMAPGTRIVSHHFDMGDWRPDQTIALEQGCPPPGCVGHLWTVPARIGGVWPLEGGGQLEIDQEFQTFTGFLRRDGSGAATPIEAGTIQGDTLRFSAGGETYHGRLQDGRLTVEPSAP